MEVIPVIDLKDGVVVHARRGERAAYRPITTPLAAGSAPEAVLAGLLGLFPFPRVYVADLDAIAGGDGHDVLLADLAVRFPRVEFWVDNGVTAETAARRWLARNAGVLVIGSESQSDLSLLTALAGAPRIALSLDFRGEDFQGPAALHDDAARWPERVIAMTLARVGAGAGPDFARLAEIKARAGARAVYAAGGVRSADDLAALAAAGIAGVLVASALHSGALDRAALTKNADWHGPATRFDVGGPA